MTRRGTAERRPYIAGESAEQLQQGGARRRLLDSLRSGAVRNGPRATSTADLPNPQRIPGRPLINDGGAVVPGSTGSAMLPGRIRVGALEDVPQDYEGEA